MGKNDGSISREEYEAKVKKHLDAVKRLAKRFNPEIEHISMAIIGKHEWALAYLPDAEDGSSRKVSDFFCLTEKHEGMDPYFISSEIKNEQ